MPNDIERTGGSHAVVPAQTEGGEVVTQEDPRLEMLFRMMEQRFPVLAQPQQMEVATNTGGMLGGVFEMIGGLGKGTQDLVMPILEPIIEDLKKPDGVARAGVKLQALVTILAVLSNEKMSGPEKIARIAGTMAKGSVGGVLYGSLDMKSWMGQIIKHISEGSANTGDQPVAQAA